MQALSGSAGPIVSGRVVQPILRWDAPGSFKQQSTQLDVARTLTDWTPLQGHWPFAVALSVAVARCYGCREQPVFKRWSSRTTKFGCKRQKQGVSANKFCCQTVCRAQDTSFAAGDAGDAGEAVESEKDAQTEFDKLNEELEDDLDTLRDDIAKQAEERKAALAAKIDLILSKSPVAEAPIPKKVARASSANVNLPDGVRAVAVCGVGNGDTGAAKYLLERLRDQVDVQWIDLTEAPTLPFELLDKKLARCRAAIICPDLREDRRKNLRAVRQGLKAIIPSFPDPLSRVLLLSRIGAQADRGIVNFNSFFGVSRDSGTFSNIEDELTSTARKRSGNRPLRAVIIRAGLPSQSGGGNAVRCFPGDCGGGGSTSSEIAAEAILQALSLSVNTNFSILGEQSSAATSPNWNELLLPYVGPEIWRTEVSNAKRAAFFVQGWAEEFFGEGKGDSQQWGVKTPTEMKRMPAGVILKFRPAGTPTGREFQDLDEGGMEFIVEEPESEAPRLRIRRCSYGWKTVVKKNSERAVLQKFQQDWAQ